MVSIYNIVSFSWSINSIYIYFKTPIFLNTREIEACPVSIWSFKYNCISFIIITIVVIIIIIIIIIIVMGVHEINSIRTAELRSNEDHSHIIIIIIIINFLMLFIIVISSF